jgi:hypothetical protein
MRKFLFLGLTALGLALVSEQPAQAWVNSKFSIGLNWHRQSGGNNFLWGFYRNGQLAVPENGPFQFAPPPHGAPTFPGFVPYGPNDFQYFGQRQAPTNSGNLTSPNVPPPPTATAAQQPQAHATAPAWYGQQSLYQPVSFTPSNYGYPTTGNYAPGYYGYYLPPSYWYGR